MAALQELHVVDPERGEFLSLLARYKAGLIDAPGEANENDPS
jgi:hypothetical protein